MTTIRFLATGLALLALPVTAQAAPSVTLRPAFSPNPTQIRGRTQPRDQPMRRVFRTKSNCSGYAAARPDAVVYLPKGLGRATMRFRGMGSVYVQLPNNRYICGRSKITLSQWPAGRVAIRSYSYWGRRNQVDNFTITIEDPTRPRNLGWKKNLQKITLTKHLDKPILLSGISRNHGSIRARWTRNCNYVKVPAQPVMLLKVDRPLTTIQYRLVSNGKARVVLLGPLNRTNRNIPTRCPGGGSLGRLEPGTYAVKVGYYAAYGHRPKPTAYTLMLRTANTKVSPLTPVANIPTGLAVRERDVTRYYPQLPKGFWRSTAMLQALFAVAPKQLFVYAAFDFDRESAKTIPWQRAGDTYPRKNEPLLVYANRWVVAADGSTWSVKRYNYLKTSPAGAISLPRKARNTYQKYRKALDNAGPKDRRSIKRYSQAVKRNGRCAERIWNGADRRIRALRMRSWSRWRARQIQNIKDRTSSRVFRACGTKQLRRMKDRLHKRLMRTRSKRRTARLKKIRARLMRIFP